MRLLRRGRDRRARSSRGHVRVEQGRDWVGWAIAGVTVVLVIVTAAVLISRFVLPLLDQDETASENRTWLEFEWTRLPVNQSAVEQLAQRFEDNKITRVYLEANAWQADGTLIEGEYTADFASALRAVYPDIRVLLWLRMSGEEIAQEERRAVVTALAEKAVDEWHLDGVQLNGRAVYKDSEAYIQLVRNLRGAIGDDRLLSLTVPPDRIPTNPDIPVGSTLDADLTWDANYKQRVGLLQVDEMVIMAFASGLLDSGQYQVWVGYQIASYVDSVADLEQPPDFVIALPTYDTEAEHDASVETIQAAAEGVKLGLNQAGDARREIKGVGLYEYKTTDSLEWAQYREYWLQAAG